MGYVAKSIDASTILAGLTTDSIKWKGADIVAELELPVFKFCATDTSDNFQSRAGAGFARVVGSNHWTGAMLTNAVCAINDEVSLGIVYIPITGDYTVHTLAEIGSSHGIAHFMLNNVDKGTIDYYNGSQVYNDTDSVSLGTLTAGLYVFTIKMASKNGASADYYIQLTSLIIVKT